MLIVSSCFPPSDVLGPYLTASLTAYENNKDKEFNGISFSFFFKKKNLLKLILILN